MIDSHPMLARVCGPKITRTGFESKASTGVLKLMTAIQMIGNAATKHQNARNPFERAFKLIGWRWAELDITLASPLLASDPAQRNTKQDRDPDHRQDRAGRCPADRACAGAVLQQEFVGQPLQRSDVGRGRKADSFLKHPVGVHQVDKRQENHKRHKMRNDNISQPLPSRCAINDCRFHCVIDPAKDVAM